MTEKKIKVFVLADSPLAPSGVGIQTRYMIEGLLKTGKYQFVCFAGAIQHNDYKPITTEEYGEDWIIFPVDGYGNQEKVRALLQQQRPDIVWIMTDPRFWGWLWDIENEIRSVAPLVYYHVWDNYPYPTFNRRWYLSNDYVACISKVTEDIVKTVAPEVESKRITHTVNLDTFSKLPKKQIESFRRENNLGVDKSGNLKFMFFWNNRNARRKQSGSVLWWFNEFLNQVGRDKACLLMHTEPKDPNGQDLNAIIDSLEMKDGEIYISNQRLDFADMAMLYNAADCTVNISDAEGFGLATLESLACETPIIVNMTGGLQEQVTNGKEWYGIGIEPSSKAVIGSQDVPWIYEDRISKEDFLGALTTMFEATPKEREKMGKLGRQKVERENSLDKYVESWDEVFQYVNAKYGSWETKTGKSWSLTRVL